MAAASDPVVIVSAVRTPLGRFMGELSPFSAHKLGSHVIGAALEAKAAGVGHRSIATGLGRPVSTVRGWLRRFAARAEQLRAEFTRLLVALDPLAAPVTPRARGRCARVHYNL